MEEAISPRTKGIIAVHLYGHPADMDELNRIAAVTVFGWWKTRQRQPWRHTRAVRQVVFPQSGRSRFTGIKYLREARGGLSRLTTRTWSCARTLRGQGMDPKRRYFFPVFGYNFRSRTLPARSCAPKWSVVRQSFEKTGHIFSLWRLCKACPVSDCNRSRHGRHLTLAFQYHGRSDAIWSLA